MAERARQGGPKEAYISFSGGIQLAESEALVDRALEASERGVERLVLCLASFGGHFARAVGLGNTLRALPPRLVTFNVGFVASAANTLFLAGEERYAARHATFGFHPSSIALDGPQNPTQLAERRAQLIADDEREERIVAAATKLTRAEARAIVQGSRVIGAREALAAGIVHGVKELKIPRGALVLRA
ncbi:MAG TPA: ATP-dependent Clp protease proteolytic subunit [Solirubrobacteraceae bacterium]|nr:ATP-dependent Clp protease proteolytic subunit [Solirubrobacteraceae bacterium]